MWLASPRVWSQSRGKTSKTNKFITSIFLLQYTGVFEPCQIWPQHVGLCLLFVVPWLHWCQWPQCDTEIRVWLGKFWWCVEKSADCDCLYRLRIARLSSSHMKAHFPWSLKRTQPRWNWDRYNADWNQWNRYLEQRFMCMQIWPTLQMDVI